MRGAVHRDPRPELAALESLSEPELEQEPVRGLERERQALVGGSGQEQRVSVQVWELVQVLPSSESGSASRVWRYRREPVPEMV